MIINGFLKGIDMNKKLLMSLACVAFFTLQADEQNSSDVQIRVTIDKELLDRIVKKKSSPGFVEKIFNIGGNLVCGGGSGAILGAAILLYHQTVVINNTLGLQGQVIMNTNDWNKKVLEAFAIGACAGGAYGFLNGVYKNFVKS